MIIDQLRALRGRCAYWETRLRLETRALRREELERQAGAEIGRLAAALPIPFASRPTKRATRRARAVAGGRSRTTA